LLDVLISSVMIFDFSASFRASSAGASALTNPIAIGGILPTICKPDAFFELLRNPIFFAKER